MSSADEDMDVVEGFAVTTTPRENKRKADKADISSPKQVPRKKQREALEDLYVESDDNHENVEGQEGTDYVRNLQWTGQGGTKRVVNPCIELSVEGKGDPEIFVAPSPLGTNNVPLTRKRPTIRPINSRTYGYRSSVSGVAEPANENSDVHLAVYESCSKLFNDNKINPQNAFELKLLDCINDLINSPGYDKSNMLLTSNTLEVGTRIYVCRVENAHMEVLSLASDIFLTKMINSRDGVADRGNGNESIDLQCQRQTRKRGKFVEKDSEKLLASVEDLNPQFISRRKLLSKKFNDMAYNDVEFDYMEFFLEPDEQHLLHSAEELEKLDNILELDRNEFPSNPSEMGSLEFPLISLGTDRSSYVIWGRLTNGAEGVGVGYQPFQRHEQFLYNPENRPAEYPNEQGPENDLDDLLGLADEDATTPSVPNVSSENIRSVDDVDKIFQHERRSERIKKSKYGWYGPNLIIRPGSTVSSRGQRKGKRRLKMKGSGRINFSEVNWNSKDTMYKTVPETRITFGKKTMEKLLTETNAFLAEVPLWEDDDSLDVLEDILSLKKDPSIIRSFTNPNRTIQDSSETSRSSEDASGSSDFHFENYDEYEDRKNDTELSTNMTEDCIPIPNSQQTNDEGLGFSQSIDVGTQIYENQEGSQVRLSRRVTLTQDSGVGLVQRKQTHKPFNVNRLKTILLNTVISALNLDPETAKPLSDEETSIELHDLMFQVIKQLDPRTERLLNVPLLFFALTCVVAENKLHMVNDIEKDPGHCVVLCLGKNTTHKDRITVPDDDSNSE